MDSCKGTIKEGYCRKCYEYVLGDDAYSFKAIIADVDNDKDTLTVTCAEGAGRSMFKAEASEFVGWTDTAKKDAIENLMFVPKKAGCWVKIEANKLEYPLVVIYNVRD